MDLGLTSRIPTGYEFTATLAKVSVRKGLCISCGGCPHEDHVEQPVPFQFPSLETAVPSSKYGYARIPPSAVSRTRLGLCSAMSLPRVDPRKRHTPLFRPLQPRPLQKNAVLLVLRDEGRQRVVF